MLRYQSTQNVLLINLNFIILPSIHIPFNTPFKLNYQQKYFLLQKFFHSFKTNWIVRQFIQNKKKKAPKEWHWQWLNMIFWVIFLYLTSDWILEWNVCATPTACGYSSFFLLFLFVHTHTNTIEHSLTIVVRNVMNE